MLHRIICLSCVATFALFVSATESAANLFPPPIIPPPIFPTPPKKTTTVFRTSTVTAVQTVTATQTIINNQTIINTATVTATATLTDIETEIDTVTATVTATETDVETLTDTETTTDIESTTVSFPVSVTVTETTTAPGATTTVISDQCNTGSIQCCNTVQNVNSTEVQELLQLLGVILDDPNISAVGMDCSPMTGSGDGSGSTCVQDPVCCENDTFNGSVAIGCSPIIINL